MKIHSCFSKLSKRHELSRVLGSAAVSAMLLASHTVADSVIFEDFEGADYGSWTVTGTAFGTGPYSVRSVPTGAVWNDYVSIGNKVVNSFLSAPNAGADTGTLTSPDFVISYDYIHFFVGGGNNPTTERMRLLDSATGEELRTVTGDQTQKMRQEHWNVSDLIGRNVKLEIEDGNATIWKNISIDHIVFSSEPGVNAHGYLAAELWRGLGFFDVSELVEQDAFYEAPFAKPNVSLNYTEIPTYTGGRFRGYITAPETGNYTFWVSASTSAQLWLSTDDTKYRKRLLAKLGGDTGSGSRGVALDSGNLWDVYTGQMSEEVYLEAGQKYFIEVLTQQNHVEDGVRHVSVAWARPGQNRESISTEYLDGYLQETEDADDDYLPDAWETQFGLNVTDNGLRDRNREGERGDFDGDGLSNREEYIYGTDPTKADTDGDGVSDFDEIHRFGTSPVQSDLLLDTVVDTPVLTNYNTAGTSGTWEMFDGGLTGSVFRGSIEWSFTVPSDGWWVIDLNGRLRGTLRNWEELNLGIRIDSNSLADQKMSFLGGDPASLKIVSPFLKAGTHTFRIDVRNEIARRTFQVLGLSVRGAGGFDGDQNGRPDWIDVALSEGNQLVPIPSDSPVSPLFIEGSTRYACNAEISAQGSPVAVERGLGDQHWYANVPLNPLGTTQLDVTLESDLHSQAVVWSRWNAFAGEDLTIRVGDSLKIGGWIDGTSGLIEIDVHGSSHSLTQTDSFIQLFSQAGDYTLTATHPDGTIISSTVRVMTADFGNTNIFYTDLVTWRSYPGVPQNLEIYADPGLVIGSRLAESPGQKLRFQASTNGVHSLAARIPGGPIVAMGTLTTMGVSDAVKNDADNYIGSTPDGYFILRTPIVVTDLPVGGRVRIAIFRSGVTFMDGTTVLKLYAEDFVNGVAFVDFRYPATMTGGYCHYIDVYDAHNNFLGRR